MALGSVLACGAGIVLMAQGMNGFLPKVLAFGGAGTLYFGRGFIANLGRRKVAR